MTRTNRLGAIAELQKEIREQRQWIDGRGGDLAGYRAHYAGTYQLNIDEIYAADVAALAKLRAELAQLTGRRRP